MDASLVTWGQFQWIIGGLIALNITILGYTIAAVRLRASGAGVSRLWESHNRDKEGLAEYKTEVAKNHVTHADFQTLEARLTRHFDEKWADLKADIRELKQRHNKDEGDVS